MSYSRFLSKAVGVCLSTLAPRSRELDADEVETILRACHASGFRSVAMSPAFTKTTGVSRFRQLLAELALEVRVIEAITGWTNGVDPASEETAATSDFASAVGADTLMAATIAPDLDLKRATDGFAAACRVAHDNNLRVALEFIPGTAIPDLKTAWRIVRDSGADNAGVVVDVLHWHHQPGGPDIDLLRGIPPERIHYVQLCDSPDVGTPAGEQYLPFAMSARALPGEGVADIDGLLTALDDMGADPFFALEVFNSELAASGAENMARRLRRSVGRLTG